MCTHRPMSYKPRASYFGKKLDVKTTNPSLLYVVEINGSNFLRLSTIIFVKHRSFSVVPASVTFDFPTVLTFRLIMQRHGNTYMIITVCFVVT